MNAVDPPALPQRLRQAILVPAALAAAIAASLLSFYLVEEPSRKLLRPGKSSQ